MKRPNWETERRDNPWRLRWNAGRALVAFGLVLIAAAALYLASAGYGDHVRELPERKSYNQVKTDVHRVWIGVLCLGMSGVFFVIWGGRSAARAERDEQRSA